MIPWLLITALMSSQGQALSALLNLGYPRTQAERVLAEVAQDDGPDDVEAYVRGALKRLGR